LKPMLEARQLSARGIDNQFTIVNESHWECTAAVVGQIAVDRFGLGQRDDLWTLEPHYFRPSYAEEGP
jgi:hypothetical protein